MNKEFSTKASIIIILTFTVTVAICVAVWFFINTEFLNIVSTFVNSNNNDGSWKTYANNEFGYSFQYPASWFVSIPTGIKEGEYCTDFYDYSVCYLSSQIISNYSDPWQYDPAGYHREMKIPVRPPDLVELHLGIIRPNVTLDDYVQKDSFEIFGNNYDDIITIENISLNNKGGVKRYAKEGLYSSTTYFFEKDGNILYFSYNSEDKTIEQVINSFKISN